MGVVFSPDNKNNSRWARVKMKVASLRAGPDVQGLLQVDGCQQGWHPGQERPAWAFDNIGVLMSEGELDELMGEVGGPCNVNGMINMFQEKMAGAGNDPDELILQAFMAYGDKMNKTEIDDIFNEFEIDRTTWSRPRRLFDSLLLSRRKKRRRRRRKKLPLKLLLMMRVVMMPRRRRRRRRRPPSK